VPVGQEGQVLNPDESPYVPGPQLVHTVAVVAPTAEDADPGRQERQLVAAFWLL